MGNMLKIVSQRLGVDMVGDIEQDRQRLIAKIKESNINQEDFRGMLKEAADIMLSDNSLSVGFADGSFFKESMRLFNDPSKDAWKQKQYLSSPFFYIFRSLDGSILHQKEAKKRSLENPLVKRSHNPFKSKLSDLGGRVKVTSQDSFDLEKSSSSSAS